MAILIAGAAGVFGVAFFYLAVNHYWSEWRHDRTLATWRDICHELRENGVHYRHKPLGHPRCLGMFDCG
jgi:hypothetical protein